MLSVFPLLCCPVFISQNSPVTSVLKKMLEFLVSDELRTFQWLVGDHVTEEGRPLTVGELLQFADGQTTIKDPQTIEKMRVTLDILVKIVPTLCTSTQTALS